MEPRRSSGGEYTAQLLIKDVICGAHEQSEEGMSSCLEIFCKVMCRAAHITGDEESDVEDNVF